MHARTDSNGELALAVIGVTFHEVEGAPSSKFLGPLVQQKVLGGDQQHVTVDGFNDLFADYTS